MTDQEYPPGLYVDDHDSVWRYQDDDGWSLELANPERGQA